MSDSKSSHSSHRHHHHHHHGHGHRYDGPRSSRADGLSNDYQEILSDENYDEIELNLADDLQNALNQDENHTKDFHENLSAYLQEEAGDNVQDELNKDLQRSSLENASEHRHIGNSQSRNDSSREHSGERSHHSRKHSRRRKKHMDSWSRKQRKSQVFIRVLIGIVVLLLLMIGSFALLRYRGEQNLKKSIVETPVVPVPEEISEEVDQSDENLIIYNGERYWYNEDIIVVLCMGVDRSEFASPDDMVIGGNGQADADVLVLFDKKNGKTSFLNISRDCIAEIDRYNQDGQYLDTVKEQLCLSYAFGNGKQTSCENTALSVSRLLYGMPINAYAAIDFESIATLNDAVGGVQVPITEDIAAQFPGAQVGALVDLVGSEAVTYVRSRDTALLDSNNARMSRQRQYIIAFLKKAVQQIKADPTKALSLFNSVSDNMVTSIKLSEVTYLGTFFAKNGFKEENITSVKGEVVMGDDGFAEFIPDDKALFETVLDLFYIKE